ncbi:MAG: helix-turn-helix domain-containing protein [Chloroflexota bacterium]|nr:helix-turn-helix domain-containing protein [Chloroflexota bacterium]
MATSKLDTVHSLVLSAAQATPSPDEAMTMISVLDVMRQALPGGTSVVAGRGGLGREVAWASRLRSAPPAFAHLSGGELVLLPPQVLDLLDERLTLDEAIRQLAAFGVAAIALSGATSSIARAVADEMAVPLLVLPDDVDFGTLERTASRYISERRREIQRRGQEAGRQLMELAIAGDPISTLATELATIAGRAVAIEGADGSLLAFQAGPSALGIAQCQALIADTRGPVMSWLRTVATTSPAEPPSSSYRATRGWLRIVAPVSGRDGLIGTVSLFVQDGEHNVEDGMFASRGAAACAVALAREQAAAGARREIELNVLDEILDGALRSEVSLLQQIKRLGHDLTGSFCTMIARVDSAPGAPARARNGRWSVLEEGLQRAAHSRDAHVLWRVRNTSAEIVWPVIEESELAGIVTTVRDELNATISRHASSEVVSLGVGRIHAGLEGIRLSHQDARQALTIGRRLHGSGSVTTFETLGVYRLIYAAEHLPELRTFQDEALAPLIAYDRDHGAELIRTLEAFFAANCSPKEAASLLHVHRNTVLYRLERIADITGFDLNASDVRLRLHLALHVRLALSA